MRFKEFRLFEQAAEKLIIPDSKGGQTVINGVKIKPGTSQRLQQFLLKNPDLPEAAKAEVVRRIAVNSNIKQVVKANPSVFGKVISGLGNLGRLIVGRVLGIANILGDSTALNADEDALVELDRRMHEQDPDLFTKLILDSVDPKVNKILNQEIVSISQMTLFNSIALKMQNGI